MIYIFYIECFNISVEFLVWSDMKYWVSDQYRPQCVKAYVYMCVSWFPADNPYQLINYITLPDACEMLFR